MMKIKNVTIFGTDVLGAQIAFQTAYHGYDVTLFDISKELLVQAKEILWDVNEYLVSMRRQKLIQPLVKERSVKYRRRRGIV